MENTGNDYAKREVSRMFLAFLFLFLLAISALAAFGGYIYARVDSEFVRDNIERIAREEAGLDLTIGDLKYEYPSAVYMKDVSLVTSGGKTVTMQKLDAYLVLESLLMGSPKLRFVSMEENGYMKLDLSAKLSRDPKPKAMLRLEGYPVTKILKSEEGEPLPINAHLNGLGYFNLGKEGLEGATGELNMWFTSVNFREDAFKGTAAFEGKESFRQSAIEKFDVSSATCNLKLEKGRVETDHCLAVTTIGDFEFRMSEKISTFESRNPIQVDMFVWQPKDFMKIYFLFNSRYKEGGGVYRIPMIFTFADIEEIGTGLPVER